MRLGSAHRAFWLLAFPLLGLCLASARGHAGEPAKVPRAVILFDGSGSMWGKLGGQGASKLSMSQDAFNKAIPALRQPLHLGLVMFGGRQSQSCDLLNIMIPASAEGGRKILDAAGRFNPQGRGPLTLAMRKAGEDLKADGRPASMILIHDGPDNCSQDPCLVARELKAANRDLTIHVLSLGLEPAVAQSISCISKATGGRHFKIFDKAGLDAALQQSLKLAALRSAVPAPKLLRPIARALKPDNGKPGLRLSALLKAGGIAVLDGLRWRIVPGEPAGKAAAAIAPVYEGGDSQPLIDLEPGSYSVSVQLGQVRASGKFTVGAKGKTTAKLVLNAGSIRLRTLTSRGGVQVAGVFYTVSKPTKEGAAPSRALVVEHADTPTFHLPPGSYVITAQRGLAQVQQRVTILAGSIANLDLVLNMGELALSAVAAKGAAPEGDVYFFVYDDGSSEDGNPRQVARSGAKQPIFALPVGTYRVQVRSGQVEASERISVLAGRRTTRAIPLSSAKLRLSSRLSHGDMSLDGMVSYRVVQLSDPEREIARTTLTNPTLRLPAGRYRIEGRFGGANAIESLTVTLINGADQQLNMEYQAGTLQLRLSAIQHGLALADVFWDIKTVDGHVIWSSGQAEPRVALRAGRYKVAVERRGRQWERLVEVMSGQSQTLELLTR